MPRVQPLRIALLLIASVAACFVVAYAAFGPFHSPIRAHTPLNGILFAVVPSLLLLFLSREHAPAPNSDPGPLWHVGLVAVVTICAFLPTLHFPFVSDGCTHPWWAHQQGSDPLYTLGNLLTSPQEGRFYRPVSFFSYYLNEAWAGLEPSRWRLLNILFHAANTILVSPIARRLGFSHAAAILAALLFGLHGTRPEAVVWVGAHFEVLTTLFCLASFYLWLRGAPVLSLLVCLLALLSKESAFILPALITLTALALRRGRPWWRASLLTWPYYAIAAAVFAWRWHMLHGIGGYVDPHTGKLTILNFNPLLTLKAMLLRIWTILGVPVNWSYHPEPWLVAAIAVGLAALIWTGWRGARTPPTLWLALSVILCVLPSQHLALIGQGMDGSRILYLASAPFVLLLASAAVSAARTPRQFHLCAIALVALQSAALAHNLRIWGQVAELARDTVSQSVQLIGNHAGPVSLRGFPNVVDGVYFLESGLPSCIAIQGGPSIERVTYDSPATPHPPGTLTLEWDQTNRRIGLVSKVP